MNELSKLSIPERLELVQDLWDSIDQSTRELPADGRRQALLSERLAQADLDGDEGLLTREQVWEQVQRRGDT